MTFHQSPQGTMTYRGEDDWYMFATDSESQWWRTLCEDSEHWNTAAINVGLLQIHNDGPLADADMAKLMDMMQEPKSLTKYLLPIMMAEGLEIQGWSIVTDEADQKELAKRYA